MEGILERAFKEGDGTKEGEGWPTRLAARGTALAFGGAEGIATTFADGRREINQRGAAGRAKSLPSLPASAANGRED
jgi:hypothetical protein